MTKSNVDRLDDCIVCGADCCRHVAIEIDTPTCKHDYDNIRWYLMHEKVNVFIDKDKNWNIEFIAKCRNLLEDNTCLKYTDRPKICRNYPEADDNCVFGDNESPYCALFTNAEEFERYLDNRGINWRWKKIKC